METKTKNIIKSRSRILLILFFVVGFLVLIGRLFKIQVSDGEFYKARSLRQQVSEIAVEAKRGSIYDRNENVLAQSAVVWDVCISPADILDEDWEDISNKLSEILEIPKEDILKNKEKKDSYYVKIKSGIDNPTREKIVEFNNSYDPVLRSIYFEEAPKRYYTYDNLASTLIGFTNNDNHGAYGLESYYDSILAGTPGVKISSSADNVGSNAKSYKAEDGHSIVLTIDEVIQSSVEKHLEMAIVEHNIKNGAAGIVMNIQTGEILAMASLPDFNPNDPYTLTDPKAIEELAELDENSEEYKVRQKELWYYQWRNKAISDPYEPGSVYKIITSAISIEEQKSFLDDYFYCSGSIEVADRTMNCWLHSGHGGQDFYGIMKNSCNPAFVTVGFRNGAQKTSAYMADFGLGRVTGIDLPGEADGIIHSYETLSGTGGVYLASSSFGQSFKTTPIQLITAVSAAINGGYLVEPYIVRQIMDSQGNIIETVEPKVKRQVISKATSDKLRDLVEGVVSDGSGRNAAVPGYRIGGKTGTSEKLDLLPKRQEYVLSFVGFAPMENPTYAVLIVLDEPQISNALASVIAAPIAGAIFQEILPYLGVEPHFSEEELMQRPVKVPYLVGMKPHDAQAELTALGLKAKIIGQGTSVIRQVPLTAQETVKGGTVTLFCSEEELNTNIIMPDLTSVPKNQAKKQLNEMGLNVIVEGDTSNSDTIVKSQWPLPGEKITSGDTATIGVATEEGKEEIETLPELPSAPDLPETDPALAGDGQKSPIVQPDPNPEPEKSKTQEPSKAPDSSSSSAEGDGAEVVDS